LITYLSKRVLASTSALASPWTSNLLARVSETSVLPISSLLGSSGGRGFSPEEGETEKERKREREKQRQREREKRV